MRIIAGIGRRREGGRKESRIVPESGEYRALPCGVSILPSCQKMCFFNQAVHLWSWTVCAVGAGTPLQADFAAHHHRHCHPNRHPGWPLSALALHRPAASSPAIAAATAVDVVAAVVVAAAGQSCVRWRDAGQTSAAP